MEGTLKIRVYCQEIPKLILPRFEHLQRVFERHLPERLVLREGRGLDSLIVSVIFKSCLITRSGKFSGFCSIRVRGARMHIRLMVGDNFFAKPNIAEATHQLNLRFFHELSHAAHMSSSGSVVYFRAVIIEHLHEKGEVPDTLEDEAERFGREEAGQNLFQLKTPIRFFKCSRCWNGYLSTAGRAKCERFDVNWGIDCKRAAELLLQRMKEGGVLDKSFHEKIKAMLYAPMEWETNSESCNLAYQNFLSAVTKIFQERKR